MVDADELLPTWHGRRPRRRRAIRDRLAEVRQQLNQSWATDELREEEEILLEMLAEEDNGPGGDAYLRCGV